MKGMEKERDKGKGVVFTSKVTRGSWGDSLFSTRDESSSLHLEGSAIATNPPRRKSRGTFATKEEALREAGVSEGAIWQDVARDEWVDEEE